MQSEEENLTRESSEKYLWSEENQVYYYSKFQLFQNQSIAQNQFYQYSAFIAKVSDELGKQWKLEANHLYAPFFSSQEVFMNLLEIWLQHHPTVNSLQTATNKKTTFNQLYVEEFLHKMNKDLEEKFNGSKIKPPLTSVKAVCMGFVLTSNEIWEEMFQTEKIPKKVDLFSSKALFKGVANTIEKTFKPLMVVTQKISSVFGRKKRKPNQQSISNDCDESKFQNCYHQFKKTLDIQKHLQRKMSQFNLDQEVHQCQMKNKVIEKKEFKQNESPIKSNIISSVYSYVSGFLNRTYSWQVASNFVTNILDLNYVQMEDGMKVKVLRPAQDFYHKLVIVWLLFKNSNNQEVITFHNYLERVKAFFNGDWKEKYLIPTKYFYQKMSHDWASIQEETRDKQNLNDKQILNVFIKRIRNSMKVDWQTKIIIKRKGSSERSCQN